MNMKIRVQLLKILLNKNQHRGFTLIHLLVIMLVMGILAALALPNFLGCGNKAKQSESKTYVGALNRGQQAYYIEKGKFSNSIPALGVGIQTSTVNYQYSTKTTTRAAFNYGIPKNNVLKINVGGVFAIPDKKVGSKTGKDNITTQAILCEAKSAGIPKPADPTYQNGVMGCGAETKEVGKSSP